VQGGTIEIYPTSGQNRDNENKESSPDSCNNTDWDQARYFCTGCLGTSSRQYCTVYRRGHRSTFTRLDTLLDTVDTKQYTEIPLHDRILCKVQRYLFLIVTAGAGPGI
jgi:hypothetical protein